MVNLDDFSTVPGVGSPCIRALIAAGFPTLSSVAGVDYALLRALHGVGPRGLERIHAALLARGLPGLGGTVPSPQPVGSHGDPESYWT